MKYHMYFNYLNYYHRFFSLATILTVNKMVNKYLYMYICKHKWQKIDGMQIQNIQFHLCISISLQIKMKFTVLKSNKSLGYIYRYQDQCYFSFTPFEGRIPYFGEWKPHFVFLGHAFVSVSVDLWRPQFGWGRRDHCVWRREITAPPPRRNCIGLALVLR